MGSTMPPCKTWSHPKIHLYKWRIGSLHLGCDNFPQVVVVIKERVNQIVGQIEA